MPSTSPQAAASDVAPYDALLLYSFGGPDKPEDVVPFLRNVTAGKGIPDSRLEEVGEHYYGFGGKSPQCPRNQRILFITSADVVDVSDRFIKNSSNIANQFGTRTGRQFSVEFSVLLLLLGGISARAG